jgi:hypothetical protein
MFAYEGSGAKSKKDPMAMKRERLGCWGEANHLLTPLWGGKPCYNIPKERLVMRSIDVHLVIEDFF